ncbi:MAG: hypothetical protein MJ216_02545 [Bacilli bacterium]|nr:hypothetical protein [Bacilli bacterium]
MKILSAIGRFFARIGRWIKETAWIQPLLIVGGIFAIIFAIPHIIDGVKGWFSESDVANKFYAAYQLSLEGADEGDFVGNSQVDKLFTNIYEGNQAEVKKVTGGDRFFLAFIQKDNSSAEDLYSGIKMFKDKFGKNAEFADLKDSFKLKVIYTDTKNDDDENLFDIVWNNHYELFEELANGTYLPNTYYAINEKYTASKYEENFTSGSNVDECPMNTPLMMYFDYTEDNPIAEADQRVKGLSDVLFSVQGSSDLEKARVLKDCWSHSKKFGEIVKD